jgi:hypothetical protein
MLAEVFEHFFVDVVTPLGIVALLRCHGSKGGLGHPLAGLTALADHAINLRGLGM